MPIVAGNDILAADFVSTSTGAGDSGKVPKLNAVGKIDTTFLRFGGTGADGALAITSGATNIDLGGLAVVIKNYTSISITGTGSLTFTNPHANGTTIILKSQGNVTLTSSTAPMIAANNLGGIYGAGVSIGANTNSSGSDGTDAYGYAVVKNNKGVKGTGGGGGAGAGGALPTISTATSIIKLAGAKYHFALPGAGGAGGGAGTGASAAMVSGRGGFGGGALIIECGGAFNFTTASGISVAGEAGVAASGASGTNRCGGGGGGGGGGTCFIFYNTLTVNSGTIVVSGGAGGAGQGQNVATASGGGGGSSLLNAGVSGTETTGGASNGGAGGNGFSLVEANTEFA
jgi:hypothetical protein